MLQKKLQILFSYSDMYYLSSLISEEREAAATASYEDEDVIDTEADDNTIRAVPSAAENEVKRLGVLSIWIGKRAFFSISKSRHVFLLSGRLIFATVRMSEIDNAHQGFNVPPMYSFFFHPQVVISNNGRLITLSHPTTSVSLPWLKNRVTMSMGSDRVPLRFATVEDATRWGNEFRQYLEPKFSLHHGNRANDLNYSKELYSVLMNAALSGNKSLLSFLLANRSDTESIVRALHASFRYQRNFVDNPNALACALDCYAKDVVDSCLLLFFKLPSLTNDHIQSIFDRTNVSAKEKESINRVKAAIKHLPIPAASRSSNGISPLAPIFILLRSFSEEESLRKCLLKILAHPHASLDRCVRGSLNFERPNYWSEQKQWYSELISKCGDMVVLQDSNEMKLAVYSPLWIILKVLRTIQQHSRTSTELKRELFTAIPSEFLLEEFKVVDQEGNLVNARHFIKFFLDLGSDEVKDTLRQKNFRAAMSDEFFQALLEEALKVRGGGNVVARIAKDLLFKKKEFCENDFCVEFIEVIPRFVPCVVEELFKASGDLFTSDPDPCKLMVTFVLRLENCGSRGPAFRDAHIITLTEWVTSEPEMKLERMNMVARILDELQIDKYVHEILSPLMKSFFPGLLGLDTGGSSPREFLADQRLSTRRVRIYSKERMEDLLIGFMVTSAVARSNSFAELLNKEKNVIKTFLAPNEQFRKTAIRLLSKHYTFSKDFLDAMNANHILNDCRHFRHDALDLMTSRNVADKELFAKVATM
eukprot:gene26082-34102_t